MFKVFLSPSSQDKNIYATPTHPSEERICNLIADKVEALLRAQGIDVMQNDPSGGPGDHTNKSNAYKPDLHVPIHTNAGGGEGCEVFCWEPANLSSRSTRASQALYREISALTPFGDRGVKKNQSFYEIIHTAAPCAYCELYYHDNLTDASWIVNHISRLAEAIFNGIMAYKKQVSPFA